MTSAPNRAAIGERGRKREIADPLQPRAGKIGGDLGRDAERGDRHVVEHPRERLALEPGGRDRARAIARERGGGSRIVGEAAAQREAEFREPASRRRRRAPPRRRTDARRRKRRASIRPRRRARRAAYSARRNRRAFRPASPPPPDRPPRRSDRDGARARPPASGRRASPEPRGVAVDADEAARVLQRRDRGERRPGVNAMREPGAIRRQQRQPEGEESPVHRKFCPRYATQDG